MTNRIVNIDHQLQRLSDMTLVIEPTKTSAGKLPITENVEDELRRLEDLKVNYSTEKVKNLCEDLRIAKKFFDGNTLLVNSFMARTMENYYRAVGRK